MTPERFGRLEDFAMRMAKYCYGRRRRGERVEGRYVSCATPAWIAETVSLILNDLRSDAARCTRRAFRSGSLTSLSARTTSQSVSTRAQTTIASVYEITGEHAERHRRHANALHDDGAR